MLIKIFAFNAGALVDMDPFTEDQLAGNKVVIPTEIIMDKLKIIILLLVLIDKHLNFMAMMRHSMVL